MSDSTALGTFEQLLGDLRPKLHRYCARMTGSAIDGEDVVQDALVKAIELFPRAEPLAHAESWLFRIAHNTALDFLRRRARREASKSDEDADMIADPVSVADSRQAVAAGLQTFMRLPVAQRSSVILTDVLGYSLKETSGVLGVSLPSLKATLHRGRARLRELAGEPDDRPVPVLSEPERSRLVTYAERFNARDFDAIRDLLAEEVRLELVARTLLKGRKEVSTYFTNYSTKSDWKLVPGFADRRPAALVFDPRGPSAKPTYFILLEWAEGNVASIRDFRHARYAADDAELIVAN